MDNIGACNATIELSIYPTIPPANVLWMRGCSAIENNSQSEGQDERKANEQEVHEGVFEAKESQSRVHKA